MEKEIVSNLRSKYCPTAIILHGSRAIGRERTHSDWDIIMLFDNLPPAAKKFGREEMNGQDVEWKAFRRPDSDDQVVEIFGTYLQFGRVLYEVNSEGTDLLMVAERQYVNGPRLSNEDIERKERFIRHKIYGRTDDRRTRYMFVRHLCVIMQWMPKLWLEILHNEYAKPLYVVMPRIQMEDPEFYRRLIALYDSDSPDEQVACARALYGRLFGERRI